MGAHGRIVLSTIKGRPFFMTEFRPSSVNIRTALVGSSLGNAEKEIAAMCVTNYLTATNGDWTTEFSWESFAEWVNASASEGLNELYTRMLGMLGGDAVVKGVHGLIQGDYISREDRDGATYFTVTEKFVTFMERYASVA